MILHIIFSFDKKFNCLQCSRLDDEKEFMAGQNDTATRCSVIVKFKGNLEVTLTPLLLEGLQRYFSNK